jgi:hypothetical protein
LTKDNGAFPLVAMTSLLRALLFLSLAVGLSAGEPVLKITTPEKTLAFTAEEFAALPRTEITAAEPHTQKEHRYAGVTVHELLVRAGVPLGEKLRGPALQLVVVARCRDGYAVVYALAEFDESFSRRTILLAEKDDGQPLPEKSAPFQLITPGDKKGARWARMVTSLEIIPAGATPVAAKP